MPTSERNFSKGNAKEWKCGSYKLLRNFRDRCDWIKPSTTLRRRTSAKRDFSYRVFIVRDLYIEKVRVLLRQWGLGNKSSMTKKLGNGWFGLADRFQLSAREQGTSSVTREKDEPQNGGNKRAKHAEFSEKRTFLTSWYEHIRVRIRG